MMSEYARSRLSYLFFMLFLGYLFLLAHLFFIQYLHHDFYADSGVRQYDTMISMRQMRAPIVDRSGVRPLACNREVLSAFITPKKLMHPDQLMPLLELHFPLIAQRIREGHAPGFLYLKRHLTDDELAMIRAQNLGDIHFIQEPSRSYPLASASSVVGVANVDNVGIAGIELWCDKQLSGAHHTVMVKKDARSGNFFFDTTTTDEGMRGVEIKLSLSADLQFLVSQELDQAMNALASQDAMAIIMDPYTGEILAMSQSPYYDPLQEGRASHDLLINRTVTHAYEFGSVFKICAALAAIEEGVVTVDELIDCQGVETAKVGGRTVNTVKSSIRGLVPFHEVISCSNNIGIAQVSQRLGQKLYDHYCRLGFGKKTGIELPGDAAGWVNPPDRWSKQSLISLSYGYEVLATPLQLAKAFSIIANDGYEVHPHIIFQDNRERPGNRLYRAETIDAIRIMLEQTTTQGTAKRAAIKGYKVMSKTGTANLLINGHYATDRNIYTCAGIVEKDQYRRVIVVCVKETNQKNAYASTVAAPLFERIAQKMLIHEGVF